MLRSLLSFLLVSSLAGCLVPASAVAQQRGSRSPQPQYAGAVSSEAVHVPSRGTGYQFELDVDEFDDGDSLSVFTFGGDTVAKLSYGNRFTISDDQAPFALKAVGAAFVATAEGVGFEVGQTVGLTVLVDASASGDIKRAVVVSNTTATLTALGFQTLVLPQPVVVSQGDVYIIVTDLGTDIEDSVMPVVLFENGGSNDARGFVRVTTGAPDPTRLPDYHRLDMLGASVVGNTYVRGFGDAAVPADNVTGGAESLNPSIPQVTNLGVTSGATATLTWSAPAFPPLPPPPAVSESEPNDGPTGAQAIPLRCAVSGLASSSDPGAPGGFLTDDVEDWYAVTLPSDGPLSISLGGFGASDFDLFVYRPAGPFSPESAVSYSGGPAGVDESIVIGALAAGTYLIAVSAYDPDVPAVTPYVLNVSGAPFVSRYNVYAGPNSAFQASPDTFFGAVDGSVTSLVIREPIPHGYYRVTAVVGFEQSLPTAPTSAPLVGTFETIGVYVPASSTWFLRNSNSAGAADLAFGYGAPGFGLRPITGDWDGNGNATVGVYYPTARVFFLRNSNSPGGASVSVTFGPGGSAVEPIAGDWNGDGVTTIGVFNSTTRQFQLRNSNTTGNAEITFVFNPSGRNLRPIVGDWDGDGDETIGLYNPATGTFYLRNSNSSGPADLVFAFGPEGGQPLAGDWDGDGVTTVGVYSTGSGVFSIRNVNSAGTADAVFNYAAPGVAAVVGNWDGQ